MKKRSRIRYQTRKFGRNPKELASCTGKIRHKNYARAKAAAEKIPNVRAYKCRFCDYYHIGRIPRNSKGKQKR